MWCEELEMVDLNLIGGIRYLRRIVIIFLYIEFFFDMFDDSFSLEDVQKVEILQVGLALRMKCDRISDFA